MSLWVRNGPKIAEKVCRPGVGRHPFLAILGHFLTHPPHIWPQTYHLGMVYPIAGDIWGFRWKKMAKKMKICHFRWKKDQKCWNGDYGKQFFNISDSRKIYLLLEFSSDMHEIFTQSSEHKYEEICATIFWISFFCQWYEFLNMPLPLFLLIFGRFIFKNSYLWQGNEI